MRSTKRMLTAAAIVLFAAPWAAAWGPRAQVAVVSTAAQILTKQENVALANLLRDITDGVSVGEQQMAELMPGYDTNPISAIRAQMDLLAALREGRIDPYYAFRLGVLGKAVAQQSAPLVDANPVYRDLYYADAESNITNAPFALVKRQMVDPPVYFAEIRSAADRYEEIIVREYQEGTGFRGFAGSAFADDASRSIAAVADVWYTVLRGSAVASLVSDDQIRAYYLDSMRFYIARDNNREIDAAHNRIVNRGITTPDFQKEIGDLFFAGERYDQAIREYEAVLAASPSRRDVIERISEYYIRMGDLAIEAGDLEEGQEAYQSAINADQLNSDAQLKLFDATAMIEARDARRAAEETALADAQRLLGEAEQLIFSGNFVQAMGRLQISTRQFNLVTDEFADISTVARNGLLQAESRLSQVRGEIINNSPAFSGAGSRDNAMSRARAESAGLSKSALRTLTQRQFEAALEELKRANAEIIP